MEWQLTSESMQDILLKSKKSELDKKIKPCKYMAFLLLFFKKIIDKIRKTA